MSLAPLLIALLVAAPPAPAAAGLSTGHVTYRVGGSAYVDVGELDGLVAGDSLEVQRGAAHVGWLRARDVTPHLAACDTLEDQGGIVPGDGVRWRAHAVVPGSGPIAASAAASAPAGGSIASPAPDSAVARGPAPAPTRSATPMRRPAPVRGRVGLSAWSTEDAAGGRYLQPAVDARIDGRGLAGGTVDAALDVRGRGTVPASGSPVAQRELGARFYRTSVAWHNVQGTRRLTVGRQFATSFSSVSLFDGAVAEVVGRRFGGGLLFGAQPEPALLQPSFDIVEAGAFVEAHAAPGGAARWSATLGGVTSSEGGQANRDFLFVQGFYQDRRTMFTLAQEIDVARGWRRDFQPGRFALTSTYANARVVVARQVTALVGYDTRRNVPLYRDRNTPETEFDDALRDGGWLGVSLTPTPAVRLDGDVRRRFGEGVDRSTAWSAGADWLAVRKRGVRLRGRVAHSSTDALTTRIYSGGIECSPSAATTLGVSGGERRTEDALATLSERAPWWTVDADVAVALRWSIAGSFERQGGDAGSAGQGYLGFGYRF